MFIATSQSPPKSRARLFGISESGAYRFRIQGGRDVMDRLEEYIEHLKKIVASMELEDECSTSNAFRDLLWRRKAQLADAIEFAKSRD